MNRGFKMNITLSKAHTEFIRQTLESSLYQSEQEAVTVAIDLLQQDFLQLKAELYANILKGAEDIKQGHSEEFTPQVALDIFDEIEQELPTKQ